MAEPSWDQARWRDSQMQTHHAHDELRTPQLSVPTASTPASRNATFYHYMPEVNSYESKPNATTGHISTPPVETHAIRSSYTAGPLGHRSPPQSGKCSPQRTATTAGSWRSLQDDISRSRTGITQSTEPHLTLRIPETQDLPRLSPMLQVNDRKLVRQPSSQVATSLPSFASFSEHAATRSDETDADGPEIAPMASRLPCSLCTKLQPMVQEVAVAIAELDENIQLYSNRPVTKRLDCPSDSSVRAVQWILDRVRYAIRDVQEATRQPRSSHPYQQQTPMTALPYSSPPNALKRLAGWGGEEHPMPKRPRSGASTDDMAYHSSFYTSRRGSVEFAPRKAHSPHPTDSTPMSAYPRQGSPLNVGRPPRTHQSPSSMGYSHPAAPSLGSQMAHTAGSPASSFRPSGSAHTAPASLAMSAHIADLQHQVTLKSLAHQTLQSEYSALLQKVQHERVRNQAIEKRTYVTDNELNDLTGKNEDLTEQVKALETQVEEIERKREAERADASREKEQWSRMLEMGGRLHAKNAEDRQKLLDEKESLLKRVAAAEDESKGVVSKVHGNMASSPGSSYSAAPPSGSGSRSDARTELTVTDSDTVASLERTNSSLKASLEHLRYQLHVVRRHNQDVAIRLQDASQFCNNIAEVTNEVQEGEGQVLASIGCREVGTAHKLLGDVLQSAASEVMPSSRKTPDVVHDAAESPAKVSRPPVPETEPHVKASTSSPHTRLIAVSTNGVEMSGSAHSEARNQLQNRQSTTVVSALGFVPATQGPLQYGTGRYIPHNEWMMTTPGKHDTGSNASSFRGHVFPYSPVPSPYASTGGATKETEQASLSGHSSPGQSRGMDGSPASMSASKPSSSKSSSSGTTPNALSDDAKPPPPGSHLQVNQFRAFPEVHGLHGNKTAFRPWDLATERPIMPPPPRPFGQSHIAAYSSFGGREDTTT